MGPSAHGRKPTAEEATEDGHKDYPHTPLSEELGIRPVP